MFTFSPITFDAPSLIRYQTLFSACFPGASKFTLPMLKWLYVDNPDGKAIGFDAFDGGDLAAHYVCIPTTIRIHGVEQKALLSLNTATHPKYQGKGLFTTLAQMTYRAGADQGFGSVYGVANMNSTPGFIKKLGFQLVQSLDVMIGVGRLGADAEMISRNAQFEHVWTADSLRWRCANPINQVICYYAKDRVAFEAKAFGPWLPVYAELPPTQIQGSVIVEGRHSLSCLRLYLGLMPTNACRFSSYVSIPNQIKPSPLNFIYRTLNTEPCMLEPGAIHFSFLDFDAY